MESAEKPDTSASENVRTLSRPFDPMSVDAEEEYDVVVRRTNRVRARKARLDKEFAGLEQEFVDNDLNVRTGSRKGEPLRTAGRRRRLARLVQVGSEIERLREEERFCLAALDRMNAALDRWARDTYGA